MIGEQTTFPSSYFEDKYRADIDPWKFRTSEYEREKYGATVSALTRDRYAAGLEVGCSIGILTQLLATRCARLLALDASATAIEAARSVNDLKVEFRVAFLPDEFPQGTFDLIVLSEVLYYFSRTDLERLADFCQRAITKKGEIVLCHWLGETNYPLTGVDASKLFAARVKASSPFHAIIHDDIYRLERFSFV